LLEKVLELYAALEDDRGPNDRLKALLKEANQLGARFDKIIPAVAGMRQTEATAG